MENKVSSFQNEGLKIGHAMAEVAVNHAGTEWKSMALDAFRRYAKQHKFFTTEDVRLSNEDIPLPPDTRAWGGVARAAVAEGFVLGDGWTRAQSKTVHGMVVTRWASKIYYAPHFDI
jgi:hypothetical protein